MTSTARGTFEVAITQGSPELSGAVSRFELSKTWHGDLQGAGTGVMLSGGDPQAGAAGYVAIETVHGRLDGKEGTFAFQQFGMMADGSQTLRYEVVPGSGVGHLAGLSGVLSLDVEADGTHRYHLEFDL